MRMIDMHCDTLSYLMRDKAPSLKQNKLCNDVEKMKTAGSLAQFFACFIYKDQFQGPEPYEEGYEYALQMIERGKNAIAECSDTLMPATSYEELLRNQVAGKMSAFLTIEEGGILNGRMERLEELYRLRVRLMTLTWNYENCIGFPNGEKGGLKPFGIEVVEQMNQRGMIVDVSHLSDDGFWDVLKYSQKPVVASHSNARSICNHKRNLTDVMIRALAEKGGIAGVNFYPYFLHKSGKADAQLIAEHVLHMYRVGGEDVIAIGTDFDGYDDGESDITHMGQMEIVYEAIKRKGLTERQMEKLWCGNALWVIKENL